ncbi:hypothetical protein KOL64_22095 (plasmid) [Providencia rettgeri]|uniref:Uncharacterized protein n=3 Tax=Providencia TaxID=586 RepID=A0AAJ6FTK6_PRORE|nr:hypothetical protein [Providencia rettgeri]MDL9989398.1 hypothetical protein [Providencia rettgeri]WHT96022.1 hypothetical protein KOF27_22360 [Providencia rettgeri]WJM88596.1 hypothetical protein KOL64_22095 [Providencia rettgeri]
MIGTPFSTMATEFRGQIIKTWLLQLSGTATEKSKILCQTAIELGLTERSKSIPGSALIQWTKTTPTNTPLWAAQSALLLLFANEWKPSTHVEWCGMASLLQRLYKKNSIAEMLSYLPKHINKDIAAGWITAAIEEDANFRRHKKRKWLFRD